MDSALQKFLPGGVDAAIRQNLPSAFLGMDKEVVQYGSHVWEPPNGVEGATCQMCSDPARIVVLTI